MSNKKFLAKLIRFIYKNKTVRKALLGFIGA
jgi:hypothetical protein